MNGEISAGIFKTLVYSLKCTPYVTTLSYDALYKKIGVEEEIEKRISYKI